MSEEEWHPAPPARRPSSDPALRAPGEPLPAPRAHAPDTIDPEAVRQFQQFQQFQELMRQQGGQVPLLPPARKPLWKKVLGSKLVRRLVLLALVLLALSWAYNHYFGGPDEDLPASMTGGGTNKTNVLHETTPKRTVRQVYSHIAQNDAPFVCGQFQNGAERQFATNFQAGSCEEVVAKLNAQIDKSEPGWRNTYAEPFPGAELAEEPTGDTTVVSSCPLTVRPRLGAFTMQRIEDNQWVITGHQLESC